VKYITFNKKNILFMLLLLLPERIFFFVDQGLFLSLFHIKYIDFVQAIYFVLFVYTLLKFEINNSHRYYFIDVLLSTIPLAIIAAIVSNYFFSQPIRVGISGQKDFVMILCSYYFFRTLIREKIVTTDYLWDCLYKLSFAITGVLIVQHLLADSIKILQVSYGRRFGVRITDNYTYATILLIGSLILFFNASGRKERIKAVIGLVMAYYHVVFVSQTRIVMVAYGVLTIIMAIFFRNSALKKITYLFIMLGVVLLALQTELAQFLFSALTDTSTDPSAQIREIGRAYYISEIAQSPIFGRGFPNSYDAYEAAGLFSKIALVDNGLIGFAYMYGIIGLIWYAWLSLKMFICSFTALKKGEYRFLLYTIFLQVLCPTIIWWYWRFSFAVVLTIILVMMEEFCAQLSEHKVRIYFGN
jgi:hypothetical protein